METTIVYWSNIGIMEKKMETTIFANFSTYEAQAQVILACMWHNGFMPDHSRSDSKDLQRDPAASMVLALQGHYAPAPWLRSKEEIAL